MPDSNINSKFKFSVIPAKPEHIESMVQCHIKAFPDYFSTLIGPRFLRASSRFYTFNPQAIVFVAITSNNQVVGAVLGGKPELRKQFIQKYLIRLVFDIIISAARSRVVRKRLIQHITGLLKKILLKLGVISEEKLGEPLQDPKGTWSRLLSIYTHPDFVGKGVGRALMEAFEQESRKHGYKTMRLSVHNGNKPAIALYKKCGWKVILQNEHGVYFKKILKN